MINKILIAQCALCSLISMFYYNCFIRQDTNKYYMFFFEHKDYKKWKEVEKFVNSNNLIGFRFDWLHSISFPYKDNLEICLFTDIKQIGIFDKNNNNCYLCSFWEDENNKIYKQLLKNEIKDYMTNSEEYDKMFKH